MKHVLIAACAAALLAGALLLQPKNETAPRPAPERKEDAKVPVPKPAPAPIAPAPAPERPDPQKLLQELADALRNGDPDLARSILERLRDLVVPEPVPDGENAAVLYQKAFEAIEKVPLEGRAAEAYDAALRGETLTPEQAQAIRDWMEANSEAFRILREAAKRPRCRFPLDYNDGFAMLMPHVTKLIRASKMLRVEAIVDGNADSSWANLAVGRAARSDSVLVSQLVGTVVDGIAFAEMPKALGPSGVLAEYVRGLDPASVREAYSRSLLGEVYLGVESLLKADPETLIEMFAEGAESREEMRDILYSPLRNQDLAYYVESMAQIIRLSEKPYGEVREELETLEKTRTETAPWYAVCSKLVMPAAARATQNVAQAEARLSMAKLALDLEGYRGRHGDYPPMLDTLRVALPRDPFTGQSFRYRREGGGYVIESPGGGEVPLVWRK